jgi:hypothetical protein
MMRIVNVDGYFPYVNKYFSAFLETCFEHDNTPKPGAWEAHRIALATGCTAGLQDWSGMPTTDPPTIKKAPTS